VLVDFPENQRNWGNRSPQYTSPAVVIGQSARQSRKEPVL